MVEQEKLVHFLAIHTKLVPLLPSYLNNGRKKIISKSTLQVMDKFLLTNLFYHLWRLTW